MTRWIVPLVAMFSLWTAPAWAAVSVISTTKVSCTAGTSHSAAMTVAANTDQVAIVAILSEDADNPVYSAAARTGDTVTQIYAPTPDVIQSQYFQIINPGVNSNPFTFTASASTDCLVVIVLLSGADQTTPVTIANIKFSQSANRTSVSEAVTSAIGGLVVDFVNTEGANNPKPDIGSGQTETFNHVELDGITAVGSWEAGAASVTMSWTSLDAFVDNSIVALPINASSGGGAPPPVVVGAATYADTASSGCSTPSDTDYDPATRACGSGTSTVYNTWTACADAIGQSEICYIRSGTYTTPMSTTNYTLTSGTSYANAPLVAAYPGETVTIKPTTGNVTVLFSSAVSYFRFGQCDSTYTRGLIFDGSNMTSSTGRAVINSQGTVSDHIIFECIEVHNSFPDAAGIFGSQGNDNWEIRFSKITGNCDHDIYTEADSWIIEHNILGQTKGSANCSPNNGSHIYSIAMSDSHAGATSNNHIVQYNVISGQEDGMIVDGNNNLIYRNHIYALTRSNGIEVGYTFSSFNKIYHNTITGAPGSGIKMGNFCEGSGATCLTNEIRNNVVVANVANITVDTAEAGGTVQTGNKTTGALADCFTQATSSDFTQKAASTCIDAGTAISGYNFNGAAPDQGALESFTLLSASVNENFLDATLGMSLNTPVRPSSGQLTWTALVSAVARTTVTAARLTGSDSIVRVAFNGAACAGGQTWTVTGVGTNITDSSLIGATINQPMIGFTASSVTNACGTTPPADPGTPWISYLLDDNTGTNANDETVNNLDGTLTGGPTWTTGKHSFGVNFANDTTDRYIAIPYGSGVNPSSQSLTVCLGVLPDAGTETSQKIVFSSTNGTNQRFYIGRIGGFWGIGIQSSGMSASTIPVAAAWTRLCLVADSGADIATLYVNGVPGTGVLAKAYTSYTLAANMRLGNDGTFSTNNGASTVDDFKLYTSALSAANILTEFQGWEPVTPPPAGTFLQPTHQFFEAFYSGGVPVQMSAIGATNTNVRAGTPVAVVIQTDCTTSNCQSISQGLYVSVDGGTAVPLGDVMGTEHIAFYGATADPLVLNGAVSCCLSGALTANSGTTQQTSAQVPSFDLAQDASIVQRYVLQIGPSAPLNRTFEIKARVQGGTLFSSYTPAGGAKLTVTPGTSISAPTALHAVGASSNTIIELVWAPTTDADLAGYKVYQTTTSGVYGLPVQTITAVSAAATHSPMTTWRTNVTSSATYCFVVTAFDTGNQESPVSNEVCIVRTGTVARTPVVR